MAERRDGDEEEAYVIEIGDKDVVIKLEACNLSLVGKLVADKNINTGVMQAVLFTLWNKPTGFLIVEIGDKTFQFFFTDERDLLRMLQSNPWVYKNSFLL
ncbi:hypothetical protein L6164_013373 [Bauhinia variegata]|uniref:Uncharacterized protein n=1 Tax=Bauhinia variegata TaxID=167791 RepID=A0ACB9NIX3_BAUVA|nr:hypothetical protein L6164_013373 [Bauhinia variegata]